MRQWAFFVCAALALTSPVRADMISYQYVTDAVVNGGTIYGEIGQTIPVKIYLQENLPFEVPSLIANQNGFSGFAVGVAKIGGAGATTIDAASGVVNTTDFPIAATPVPSSGSATRQDFLASVDIEAISGPIPDGLGRIYLATAYLTVGSDSTTFGLVANGLSDPFGPGNTMTIDLTDLDVDDSFFEFSGTSSNPFTFNVAAIPEPGSLILTGIVIGGFLVGRKRESFRLEFFRSSLRVSR